MNRKVGRRVLTAPREPTPPSARWDNEPYLSLTPPDEVHGKQTVSSTYLLFFCGRGGYGLEHVDLLDCRDAEK